MSDTSGNQPDLDLIRLVQQARMRHDAEALPSAVDAVYWIESKRAVDGCAPTPRAGAFVLLTTLAEVDTVWGAIKGATEAGDLGYKSRVATAARGSDTRERILYVMTCDADDSADLERVRAALARLGLMPIRYERVRA